MPEVRGIEGVPDYRVDIRSPRTGDALVAVPVLNEGERIQRQLEQMGRLDLENADLAVADGGSTDGSLTGTALQAGRVRALLVKTGPGGLSAQLRMLFHWAIGEGYEYVVTIDGNGKDGLEGIERVLDALRAGNDYVQGSRYMPGGVAENTPASRHWGVKLVHAPLLSLAGRHRYTDTTNGLRGWRTAVLRDPRVAPLRDAFERYSLHYYLSARIPRLGYRVCEVPASRRYPERGQIPTKITGVRPKLQILGDLVRVTAGSYNP